ncbi:hypothetical protein CRUP_019641 [Coryphaenoides rupestris]|nr:hypothetical protein CRUP_019641 [Coryphaenoides rupestris]
MAADAVLTLLDPFPSHLDPLHVLVPRSQVVSFPDHGYPTATVLFTLTRRPGSGCGLLLCAEESPGPGPAPGDQPVQVLVSRTVLRHHDLQDRTTGTVRSFAPCALSRVVVGSRSRPGFMWASSPPFSRGLQALVSDGRTLLAREGDGVLLPHHPLFGDNRTRVQQLLLDLVVMSCSPVSQGRITAGSCVVVADLSGLPTGPGPGPGPQTRSKVFVSDFAHLSDGLRRSGSLLAGRKVLKSGFSGFSGFLLALEGRLEVRVADLFPLLGDPALRGQDLDRTLFVSHKLLVKLGLFNREWVVLSEVEQPGTGGPPPRRGRLASLQVLDLRGLSLDHLLALDLRGLDLHSDQSFGFISTGHWFNLSGGASVPTAARTLRIKRWSEPIGRRSSPSACSSASPPFASQLHLAVVQSPQYHAHRCYDSMLAHHFTTARCPVLYFKVSRVFGPGDGQEDETGSYLADELHTSLYTGGATNSLVPFCSPDSSLWSSLSPAGLGGTVDHITSIIMPHLRRGAALGRCNILLQGLRGNVVLLWADATSFSRD